MSNATLIVMAVAVGFSFSPSGLAGEPTDLFLDFPGGGPFGPPMLDPPGVAAISEYRANPNIDGLLTNPDALLIDLRGQPAFTVARTRFSAYPSLPTEPPKAGGQPLAPQQRRTRGAATTSLP